MSKFNDILATAGRTASRIGLKVKKHSPEILVVTGVVGTVAATVMACKATTKATDILEEYHYQMDAIHKVSETESPENYSEEDKKKDTAIVYTQTAVKFAKLYGPAIFVGVMSIACILGSHKLLTKRNAALAAAYAGVDTAFKEYRGRVVERFGKALDKELRYDIKERDLKEGEVVTDENGNELTGNITVTEATINKSDYAKFFDEYCTGWTKDPEMNLYFLNSQQNYANDKLKSQGYLFLNDVYKMLGIPVTKAGQCVGWIYDEKNPVGDNFVDFGIFDMHDENARLFVNGYERSILLDFNVDGNILDLI